MLISRMAGLVSSLFALSTASRPLRFFADDGPATLSAKNSPYAAPDEFVVIRHQDTKVSRSSHPPVSSPAPCAATAGSTSCWPPMSFTRLAAYSGCRPHVQSDTYRCCLRRLREFHSLVAHLQCDPSRIALNSYLGLGTSRMPLDVGETFLNHAEQSQLDTWLHPSETRRCLQFEFNSSPLQEGSCIVTNRILKSGFIQHRWVQ